MSDSTTSLVARSPWQRLFGDLLPLLGFALAMPVAWGSVAMALLLPAWLLRGDWAMQWQRLRASAAARWTLALCLMLVIGASYSSGSSAQIHYTLLKYAKLLLLPILVMAASETRDRRRAIDGFLLGLGVEIAVSFARWTKFLPVFDPTDPYTGLLNHIALSFMLALGSFILVMRALDRPRQRWRWLLACAVVLFDLVFVCSGRTGYVVFLALLVFTGFRLSGRRGLLLGLLGAVLAAGVAVQLSETVAMRTQQAIADLQALRQHRTDTPLGLRITHAAETLRVIAEHPWLGGGTGSLLRETSAVAGSMRLPTQAMGNSENQYLQILAELGLPGLVLLFGLARALWRSARRLPAELRWQLQGLIVAVAVAGLFNSILLDAPEGRLAVVLAGLLAAAAAPAAAAARSLGESS